MFYLLSWVSHSPVGVYDIYAICQPLSRYVREWGFNGPDWLKLHVLCSYMYTYDLHLGMEVWPSSGRRVNPFKLSGIDQST